jgi:hypothetical protein
MACACSSPSDTKAGSEMITTILKASTMHFCCNKHADPGITSCLIGFRFDGTALAENFQVKVDGSKCC